MKGKMILFSIIMLFFVACKDNTREQLLRMENQKICLYLDSMDCRRNGHIDDCQREDFWRLVVFSDSVACSSCKLREMQSWIPMMERLSCYDGKVKLIFIFQPKDENLDVFDFTMKILPFSFPVYVDTANVLLRNNPSIPIDSKFHTFLLDENNKVLLVGNPLENEKIEDLFWQIVEERLGKRESK